MEINRNERSMRRVRREKMREWEICNGEVELAKGLKCEVCVNGAQLDQVSVFRYFGCFWWIWYKCCQVLWKNWVGRKLQLLWGPWLMLGACSLSVWGIACSLTILWHMAYDTMIWKEKEMSRIRAVQMDNLRGLLGIRKME